MALGFGTNIVTDGLIFNIDAANKRSYIGSGSVLNDLSSKKNHMTIVGSTLYSDKGGALSFVGNSSTYCYVNDNVSLRPANFTASVWVKFNSFSTYNCVFTKPQTGPPWSSPYLSWMIRINNSSTFECGIGSTSYYSNSASYSFQTGAIYNLIMTFDGSYVKGYINGILKINTARSITVQYQNKPMILGASYGLSPVAEVINGYIYQASLYNRALSTNEISLNYKAFSNRFEV